MLTWFRNNAKIFLIAIVVIFVGMIFLEWGRGGIQNVQADELVVGTVNGTGLQPTSYDYVRDEVYNGMKLQMQRMGDPDPENQLALMYNDINNTAFEVLVDRTLQSEYLRLLGWEPVKVSMAEALLKSQLQLVGIEDPDSYIDEYRGDPNFGSTLYQMISQADMAMYDAAVSLENMISANEVEFLLGDVMTTVTARYIPFSSSPELPSSEELETFYEANTNLFVTSPGARIRFATFAVQPTEEDVNVTLAMVDSLAISGTGQPDTFSIIREQLEGFAGWNIDLAPGDLSQPFIAASMNQTSLSAGHSVELLSVRNSAEDTTGSNDTLTLVHWEIPLFPGYRTVRATFWDLEEEAENILLTEFPVHDQQALMDYGELIIDLNTVPSADIPQSLISFATDSIWMDSIGPVFYVPSFSTGYPALMVARKLEDVPGGQLSYQEALDNNSILLELYSQRQSEESLALASSALESIVSSGNGLVAWAEAESIEVYDTQQFTPVSIRQWAASDQAAYRGLLGCTDFADFSLMAPEFTVLGPFSNNGVSYLVEIVTRTEPQMPETGPQLAGFYLSVQSSHHQLYSGRLMSAMRTNAEIADQRIQYYNTMDSLRAEYAATQEAME
ncbi:MAG: SurA N-terminal domain-containing protein [Candidatus Sabulitectum sp.]|nr:SurA N-terminal domain-containing protein [Candidatus Sabulitectum sp.]